MCPVEKTNADSKQRDYPNSSEWDPKRTRLISSVSGSSQINKKSLSM